MPIPGSNLEKLINQVAFNYEDHEREQSTSKGKRKYKRQTNTKSEFLASLGSLISELIWHHFLEPNRKLVWLAGQNKLLGKSKTPKDKLPVRSKPRFMQSQYVRHYRDWLEDEGYLIRIPGNYHENRASTVHAGPTLIEMMHAFDVSISDIGFDPEHLRCLQLKGAPYKGADEVRKDYHECPVSQRLSQEMVKLNRHLMQADIVISGQPLKIPERMLYRLFHRGSFDQNAGGRLYGASWINMPKEQRKEITLQGEPAVELDFKQMMPRTAYAIVGEKIPTDDELYKVEGYEDCREGIKRLVNALLSSSYDLKNWPNSDNDNESIQPYFPAGTDYLDVKTRLLKRHKPIEPFFGSGFWATGQFHESNILMKVILECIDRNITCLPIFDCLLVPASKANEVKNLMLKFSEEELGTSVPVSQK